MKTPALIIGAFEPVGSTPEEYASHLRDELGCYARIVKVANIRLE